MRGHKAQERLRLLGKVNTEEKQTPRQRTNNYWNWWHHTSLCVLAPQLTRMYWHAVAGTE